MTINIDYPTKYYQLKCVVVRWCVLLELGMEALYKIVCTSDFAVLVSQNCEERRLASSRLSVRPSCFSARNDLPPMK